MTLYASHSAALRSKPTATLVQSQALSPHGVIITSQLCVVMRHTSTSMALYINIYGILTQCLNTVCCNSSLSRSACRCVGMNSASLNLRYNIQWTYYSMQYMSIESLNLSGFVAFV